MTTLFESIFALSHSPQRHKFRMSLLAIFLWILAITLTFLSGSVAIPYGDYLITALLGSSAFLAIASIPRRQVADSSQKLDRKVNNETVTSH